VKWSAWGISDEENAEYEIGKWEARLPYDWPRSYPFIEVIFRRRGWKRETLGWVTKRLLRLEPRICRPMSSRGFLSCDLPDLE
jgi:hypothetical protein